MAAAPKHNDQLQQSVRQLQKAVAALTAAVNRITTTPPANPATVVAYLEITAGTQTYKTPMYQ